MQVEIAWDKPMPTSGTWSRKVPPCATFSASTSVSWGFRASFFYLAGQGAFLDLAFFFLIARGGHTLSSRFNGSRQNWVLSQRSSKKIQKESGLILFLYQANLWKPKLVCDTLILVKAPSGGQFYDNFTPNFIVCLCTGNYGNYLPSSTGLLDLTALAVNWLDSRGFFKQFFLSENCRKACFRNHCQKLWKVRKP